MGPLLWLAAAIIVLIIIVSVSFIRSTRGRGETVPPWQPPQDDGNERERQPLIVGGARRVRNLRARAAARARARAAVDDEEEDDDGEYSDDQEDPVLDGLAQGGVGKIGTKKLRKLQAKAEKKAMREQEEALREDKKKREALQAEERKRKEKQEMIQKKKEEEEEKREKEEKEKRELEEYLQLRKSFVIEDEGQKNEQDEEKTLQEFVDYIKRKKVVYLEDLASEFNMRTQDAISRVQSLQEAGSITGVVDDRGKFIHISVEELSAVAKFIRQRGRVSITELVSSSNTLINLQPENTAV